MKSLFVSISLFLISFSLIQAQCMDDCVWPGDFNNNGTANNLDILALGFAFGNSGPARVNQTTEWEALTVDDWVDFLPDGVTNFKHVDGNGDGEITTDDRFVVSINYNRVNDNFTGLLGNNIEGEDLFMVLQNTVVSPGNSIFVDVHLGTANNQINNLHGVGFRLDIDTQYVENVLFDFSDSWIGAGDEILGYGKFSDEVDHAGTAITRIDGNTVSGFGKIATLEIVITDVILGLEADSTNCLAFPVQFENVLAVDAEGEDLMITNHGDTASLKHPSQITSIDDLSIDHKLDVQVYPNPVDDILQIKTIHQPIQKLTLYNQLGELILHQNEFNTSNIQLDIQHIPPGIYFLELSNKNYRTTKKIIRK